MDYDEKKKSNYIIPNKNNSNKFQYSKKNFPQQTNHHQNNGNNRNDNVEGKPPKYSNQRQIPIKNMKLNNTNSDDNISNDNNSSWLFNKSSVLGSWTSSLVCFKTYILGLISAELEPDDLVNNQLELLSLDILSSEFVLFNFIFLMGI